MHHCRESHADQTASGAALLDPDEIATLLAPIPRRDPSGEAKGCSTAQLRIELARTPVQSETIARWTRGSVVAFDTSCQVVDVYLNEQLAARGHLVAEQGSWRVRIVEVIALVDSTRRPSA